MVRLAVERVIHCPRLIGGFHGKKEYNCFFLSGVWA